MRDVPPSLQADTLAPPPFTPSVHACRTWQTGDPPLGQYKTPAGTLATASSVWYVIYVVGTVPAGISNCYKQKCLKSVDLEVMYATLWSGYWQILWGFVMFPFNWIPLPSPAPKYTPC